MQDSEKQHAPGDVQPGDERLTEAELRERVAALRRVGVFSDLPENQLGWFAGKSTERHFVAGEAIFKRGDKADWMAVYLEGESHVLNDDNALDDYAFIIRAGDPLTEVSGMLPYSRMTEFSTVLADLPTRVLLFPAALFPEMLERMPVLAQRLVGVMSDRVREATKMGVQRDKLMALGRLSAGLAHELNNPAAAAMRAADEMLGALDELRAADLRLCRQNLSPTQRTFITDFEHRAIAWQEEDAATLGALEQSDREDSLASWLEARDVEEGWRVASFLVDGGIDVAALELVTSQTGKEALSDVLARVAAQLRMARLVKDIKAGTTRISELVGAIKEYSYMDQASRQEIDLHKGIENTLLILKYKLKKKNISVVRDYAADLPQITAFGSELNQVWTNLIDNAIDAMPEGGRLKVRTKLEPVNVLVEVRDNGPGIPPEVQAHIFEPFFTTKPVGEGTGLGLDTSMKIVRKHHGNMRFETKPGDTCFQVRLPLNRTAQASEGTGRNGKEQT